MNYNEGIECADRLIADAEINTALDEAGRLAVSIYLTRFKLAFLEEKARDIFLKDFNSEVKLC